MSYATEKKRIERKIARLKRIILCVVILLIVALCVLSAFFSAGGWKYKIKLPKVPARASGEMRLHFIDVGQGDCTLIEFPDGQIALVDAGPATDSAVLSLMRYCNALGVKAIDYLVVTHADYDHYGGLFTLLDYIPVKRAYLPYGQEQTNARYAQIYERLSGAGVQKEYVYRGSKMTVDGCTIAFTYPSARDEENESAMLWLDYLGVSVLLTGDADIDAQELCMREDRLGGFDAHGVDLRDTEIIKVSHHGSATGTSAEFIEYIGAETAILSCGAGNPYGHPSKTVLDILANADVATYRTDTHGHIRITIDKNGVYKTEFC